MCFLKAVVAVDHLSIVASDMVDGRNFYYGDNMRSTHWRELSLKKKLLTVFSDMIWNKSYFYYSIYTAKSNLLQLFTSICYDMS